MAVACIALNQLPSTGGVLDQDPFKIKVILTVMSAQRERQELEAERRKRATAH